MSLRKVVLWFILFLSFSIGLSFANITLSPLKYETTIEPGKSKVTTIKVTNDSKKAITLYTSKEDFIAWDETWKPKFVKPEDQTNNILSLANWLDIGEANLTLAAWETREIPVKIEVPEKGEPGWHYWAVFFSPWAVKNEQFRIQQRIWVLMLIDVPWEVKIAWEMTDFKLWKPEGDSLIETSDFDKLPVEFNVQFENQWNVHIKPRGKIVILDEEGKELRNIGKEVDTTDSWVYLWDKLVDYIPINDSQWNVLPMSTRTFNPAWEWFWQKQYNEDWTKKVKFRSIQEFYNEKAQILNESLQPWEKIEQVTEKKKFVAQLSLSYEGKNWVTKSFSEQKEFYVSYTWSKVVYHKVVLWGWAVVIIFILYYLVIWRKKSQEKLKKQLMEEMRKQQEVQNNSKDEDNN